MINSSDLEPFFNGKLDLSETFLSHFGDKESFMLLDGKLYSLHGIANKDYRGKILCVEGQRITLEESEDIVFLERRYLEKNRERIAKFLKQGLKNVNEHSSEFLEKRDKAKFSWLEELDVEDFLYDWFIPAYWKMNSRKAKSNTNSNEKNNRLSVSLEDILRGVEKKKIFLNELKKETKAQRLAMVLGELYKIPIKPKSDKNIINFEERVHVVSLPFLEEAYRARIEKEIKSCMVENVAKAIEKANTEKTLDDKIKRGAVGNFPKNLKFEKVSENEYIVVKKIPAYTLLKKRKYYHFRETRIGIRVYSVDGKIRFNEGAFVYNDPRYLHPFVSSGDDSKERKICYGNMNNQELRMKKWGINQDYDASEEDVAKSMVMILHKANMIMMHGHSLNSEVTPYQFLDGLSELAMRKRDALSLEKKKGVRIFKI